MTPFARQTASERPLGGDAAQRHGRGQSTGGRRDPVEAPPGKGGRVPPPGGRLSASDTGRAILPGFRFSVRPIRAAARSDFSPLGHDGEVLRNRPPAGPGSNTSRGIRSEKRN
jgi:hypothetical protein